MQSSNKIPKGQLDVADLVAAMHSHPNKSLLDSYDQSNIDIIAAINHSGLTTGNPHNVTAADVGVDKAYVDGLGVDALTLNGKSSTDFIEITEKGSNNGVAELDSGGKVPASQLPSYVSDVIEVNDYSSLPTTGESGNIYITTDDNKVYRWTGTGYAEIGDGDLQLGITNATAYRGDRGKIAYDHSLLTSGNPHNVTKTDVGLGNVDNTSDINKPISTATQNALDLKANEADLADVATSGSYDDLTDKPTIPTVPVLSVAGRTGNVVLTKADVGLSNVDNTSDLNKPISTATQTALNDKEDVSNKAIDLSSPNDTKYPTTKAVTDYVGNGELDIQVNGVSLQKFDANQGNNVVANIIAQPPLVSGVNIKTVGGQSIVGPGNITLPVSFTVDNSLYLDPITNELRSNIGQMSQKWIWTTGAQEFTLTHEPRNIVYISVNGQLLEDDLVQWDIDTVNKKLSILDTLDINDRISIYYDYLITP